ncbi:transposase [Paraburkholderia ferrariae]|uniref:transposase n=1 Tax=Paraburkholderia ferrariae TaxID=386056 RepID=UPI00048439C0|nr:transposase [Paraburkholderia ferrariae]
MTPHRDITEEEWQRILPLLPELRPRTELRGRPLTNTRAVLNGVLWVMYSGATWSAMPRRYPSYQTCHRRFKAWYDEGVLKYVMAELFGEKGIELCDTIEARMRTHLSRAEKLARKAGTAASLPQASQFAPVAPAGPVKPVSPVAANAAQPFPYNRPVYRQSA